MNRSKSGALLSQFDYATDAVGQITSWTQQNSATGTAAAQTYALAYDRTGQLTGANTTVGVPGTAGTAGTQFGYIYDAAGNRTSALAGSSLVTGTFDSGLNQITAQSGGGGLMPVRGRIDTGGAGRWVDTVSINGSAAKVTGTTFAGAASVTTGSNSIAIVANLKQLVAASGSSVLTGTTSTKSFGVQISAGIPGLTGSTGGTVSNREFTYDANGNTLSDGQRTYEWDTLNQLVAINYTGSTPARRTEFAYNAAGQRVRITERVATSTTAASAVGGTVVSDRCYVWFPGDAQPAEEREAGGLSFTAPASNAATSAGTVLRRFYPQGEQILSGTNGTGASIAGNYYYTRDHLGSIREVISAATGSTPTTTATLRARYDYDLWGTRSANSVTAANAAPGKPPVETEQGFTGYRLHAATDQYLSPTRLYSPQLGRFTSQDPIGIDGGLNLYAYCGGDPVNYVDSSGEFAYVPVILAIVSGGFLVEEAKEWGKAVVASDVLNHSLNNYRESLCMVERRYGSNIPPEISLYLQSLKANVINDIGNATGDIAPVIPGTTLQRSPSNGRL